MSKDFNLSKAEPTIVMETEDGVLEIVKDRDDNIIFKSNKNRLDLVINFYTEELEEWQSYHIFNEFFHRVVGKYYLEKDDEFSGPELPEDFVNAEDRTITYHSDKTNLANSLVFTFLDNKMKVSLISSGPVKPARVTVSKKQSGYFGYYQEFNKLYRALGSIAPEQKEDCSDKTFTK